MSVSSAPPRHWWLALLVWAGLGCVIPSEKNHAIEGSDESTSVAGSEDGVEPSETGDDGEPTRPDACEDDEPAALSIVQEACGGCHGGSANEGDLGDITDVSAMIDAGLLVPGDPDGSVLLSRIVSGEMPPASSERQVSAEELETLRAWVGGCLFDDQAQCPDQPFVSRQQQLTMMADDLGALDPDDHPFTRYLTLTHLHNAGYCPEDLDRYRFGLHKALAALSRDSEIQPPVAIDPHQTIYRIDVRHQDWAPVDPNNASGTDKWALLVEHSPYAVRYTTDEGEVLRSLTGVDVPVLPADWFVHDAAVDDLYYGMIDIPATLGELETQLELDIELDIANREVVRAGFTDSTLAFNQRVIERHKIPTASGLNLWTTYDFADNNAIESDVFQRPLDFQHHGQQIMFTLPNGMYAYAVYGEDGSRRDAVSLDIAGDPDQRDFEIRSGISCARCHAEGLIYNDDEIREYVSGSVSFDAETKDAVEAIYVGGSELAAVIDADSAAFVAAVSAAWSGPSSSIEPTFATFTNFEQPVDLERAAAELGVQPDELLVQLGRLHPQLEPLGRGRAVARDVWEREFPNIVCELDLGETDSLACEDEETGGSGEDSSSGGYDESGG